MAIDKPAPGAEPEPSSEARQTQCTVAKDLRSMAFLSATMPDALVEWVDSLYSGGHRVAASLDQLVLAGESTSDGDQDTSLEDLAALSSPTNALGPAGRHRLQQRLREEASRADRGLGVFSVIVIQLIDFNEACNLYGFDAAHRIAAGAMTLVRRTLRDYDVAGQTAADEIAVILPGVTREGCLLAAERLRALLLTHRINVRLGTATWSPIEDTKSLLWQARDAVDNPREPTPVDSPEPAPTPDRSPSDRRAMLWLDGFAHPLPVKASRASQGLELSLPLSSLQPGAEVTVTSPSGYRWAGTVANTTWDGSAEPALHLRVTTCD